MFFNTGYEALFGALFSAFTAQALKVVVYFFTHKKFNFKIFTTTGGMPSSHTAGVITLSTCVGLIEGFNSIAFAVSAGYAIVIMHDAAGLRRAAGKTAATLNRFIKETTERTGSGTPYDVLKELLGHTPAEVFCGALYGVVIAYFIHYLPNILRSF